MPKWMRGTLLLLLAVVLAGCQGEDPIRQEGGIQTNEGPNQAFDTSISTCAVVEVTINPELDIYLDEGNLVRKVVCKNDDAAAACEGCNFEGVHFEIFLQSFLSRCVDLGYLQDGDDISLAVGGELTAQQEQELLQQADTVLTDFAVAQQITFSAQIETPGQGITSSNYITTYIPPNAQKEYDSLGALTGYREVLDGGAVEEVTLDASGHILQRTVTHTDGTVYTFNGQDIMIASREVASDGTVFLGTWTPDGKPISHEDRLPDGSQYRITFNSLGLQEVYEHYGPAGELIARFTRVYQSTAPLHYVETDINGEISEVWCDAQGQTLRTLTTEEDGTQLQWEFQNGEVVRETRIQTDGVQMVKEIVNGESTLERWTSPDGETWEVHYADGVVVMKNGTDPRGGTWTERFSGGSRSYYRKDDADGSFVEERYEGGRQVYHATYKAGLDKGPFTTTSEYRANGTLAFRSSTGGDGSIYEETYDGNGKPIAWRMVDASGVETTGRFDNQGQPIP